MSNELRTDQSHDISYPKSPDARGTARVYHLRAPYYMGPHESPISHIVFGLWKHRLIETGKAPSTREVRAQAETILTGEIHRKRPRYPIWLMGLFFASACVVSGLVGGKISSTTRPPIVDGIPLSANESEFIRGLRVRLDRMAENESRTTAVNDSDLASAIIEGRVDRNAMLERIRGL